MKVFFFLHTDIRIDLLTTHDCLFCRSFTVYLCCRVVRVARLISLVFKLIWFRYEIREWYYNANKYLA